MLHETNDLYLKERLCHNSNSEKLVNIKIYNLVAVILNPDQEYA